MTDLERRLKIAKDATADAGASSEHSETDLERRLRIAHEEKKQYTRSGEYRRNALQNRTESFMDIVTQGETEARAGIDRYKANRDADYYQQMNKAGATYRDQDMINRSVTGYKGAYDLWKTAFDRETDAAAARTRREREMTENPAKAAPAPEEARQQAEESVQYWQNVAREADRYGDVYRQTTAKKHLADSVENYSRATKGYFDNLKNTDPGTYYALTMTPEEIDRELELLNNGAYLDSKITNSLTNDERIMGEYWHRTPQEQRQYEHNLERARFAGETDDERNAYISSEKEAYRDARNRMLNDASVEGSVGSNQEPYNRREEITQANEARKSVLENARLTQKVIQADREGITNDPQIIASGKQKFEKDQQEIWDKWVPEQGWSTTQAGGVKMYNLANAAQQQGYILANAVEHGYVLDRMDEMTEEQRARIYSLYDRDPETALKLAQTYAKAIDDKFYQKIFDWAAKDSGWQFGRRAVGNLAGSVMNLASGLDPFGYGGQSAGKIGDALIGGAAQSATRNGWFGIEELGGDQSPISSSVPFVGRGRAGEASQLVSSMEQSTLTTLPAMIAGRYDAAAASWLETAGLLLQSSSAARSDYRESIEAGLDDTTAKIHAVAAGIAEYTFEKVSFDKLLAQNTSRMTFKKVMKDVLVQAGIEGSEELHTTLANTIMDEIISGDGKSKIDRRIAELVQGGMSMKEAKGVAEKEWLTGIVNDFIGGAASGGIMTGAHYAVGATVNTAENKIANNAVNQLVGQYAEAQTENFTDADTIEAAKNYAEARGIDASGLTEAAARARDASVEEAMSALRGSTQSETETKSISKRDIRKAGKAWTEIRTQISQDFDGKSGAQAAQLYDQMAEQYGAGIKTIVDEVVTTQARQSYLEQSQTAQELQQKVKPQVEALPEGGYKQASMRAYDQAEYQLRQQEAAKTADRLAKAGNIDTEVTYTNKDGSETTAQIAELSDDLTSVVLDNGETVPIKDVQMSADTASAIRIFSRIAGKKAASLAFREYRAYLNNGGTEGYRFAEAVATAYGQGLNGVLTPEQALKMAPDFAQEAAQRAFNAGRQKHQANIENEQARRKAAEEKAKAEGAQTVKGELRGEGSIKWEKMNATRRTRAQNQIKYLDSIAQGIGVDIELFQSEATRRGKRMAYRGEQGAWYVDKATGKPVIRIDVNAGANFLSDLNAALIATTGHELAHHFQHISPAVYDEYRQSVVQAILSTENGYEKLQRLIEHEKRINRRADGTTISTDEAIDEVIADASRDRVGDRNLWKNVADSMSDESRGKVAQWLHDRFSKILKLTKRYAGFESADLVLQSAQEYQDLIGELWQKLATQAANAVDVRESDYEAGVQAKENPSGENNSTQRNAARSVEETDAGNVIPLSERFNPQKEDIRYSQRDYGQVSDLDVVESLDEKKATTPEAKAVIREAKANAAKIRSLEQKLSELRGELKTTDRALNTRGITKLSSDMLKRMSMSNDYYENLSGWLSGKITEVYQNALDQMDRTGSVRAAGDALYNGAQEIADFLMQNAGYHENIGGKWQRARWASQFAQNEEQRQAVMNDVFASLIRDWSENRNRAPMHETEADRIAQRATRPVQKKLDETREKLETASAENAELAEKNASLTRDYESSRDYAGYLREYAKSLRNQLNDAEKAVKLAGKTTQKQEQKIADLKRKLHDALQAKKAMENAKQRAERAGERTASRLQRQLEAQIEREQRIMEGKLKPLAIQRMLAEARDTATAKARAQAQERFANQKENRKRGELRARIINLADEIQRTATRPTESKYVPASLYGAMSETLGMVSDLLESDNTKGAAKRLNIGQKILELKNEYEKIKSLDDAAIKSEYDEDISMHLGEIETVLRRVGLEPGKSYHGMTLRDLPTQTLHDLYDEISAIYKSMRDARKALAGGRAVDISTIQNSIIEQQAGIDSLNEIGKIGKLARNSMLDGLSTMRAVEMMSGWDRNAELYKTVSRIEDGAADAARWSMNYNKRMQPLKTGKNELTYRNALTKRLDWQNAKDMNSGKPVKMTKLQALQIYMSWLREESDPRVQHLHEGGTATIRDARDVLAGKASRAASNDIRVTPELMQEIKQSLTEWDQQYMDAIHEYMTEEGEATNKIHYQVKHKVLETSENYFPEMVNKDYVDAKLEETAADNLWVMAPGATNELRPGAKQPIIIDGTETVMAAHVRDMANYIGLALPIRDFAKVLNGKVATGEAYATTIRSSISPNFGQKGIDVLKHAAMDVQGGRKVERKTQIERYLNGLHGAFVRSTLLINPSVTIKQAASYAATESILSYRAVVAGNRPIFSGSDSSHSTSLIAQIFMAPDSKTAQRIYDEIDEHTALHYQRRQGMSYEELAHEALRQSGWKTIKANLDARMEQNAVGRIVRKTGARLSPVQWIQRMDVATTAAIWVACKTQSKIDGFEAGTQEFWNHTTQLYERCLRETQPMYDPLHRSERQKGGGLMQYLFPFRTVPFQNHGQIVASFEAMKAAKGTSRAKEATRFFRKTVVAQVKSAIVFSALSMLAAGLRHKPDEYMDENGEVDIGAMLGKLGIDTASTLFSVIFPLTGSETWEFGESQVNKFLGKDGKQWDIFSVGAVEMLNDMFTAAGNVVGDAAKAMQGEKVTKDSFKNHVTNLLLETSAVLGIPLENIKKYSEGIVKDVGEILDGKIPAFNNDAIERDTATNIDRYLKAWSAGDEKKRNAVLDELRGNLAASGKDEKEVNQAIRTAMNKEVKTKVVGGSWTPEKAAEFLRGTGAYSDDQINSTLVDWIKTRFEQGNLTEAEAIEAIMPYTPKKNDAERWDTVRGWAARLEHEDDEEYAWKKYEELTAAVEGREEIGGILDEYRAHGYTDKQLNNAVKGGIRAALNGGSITENEAIDLLARYVTYTKDGQAVAFDKDKAWKTVQEWQAKAENDGDPDYSYNQYDELFFAIDANKDVNGIVSELTAHGYDKDDVTKAVKGHLIDNYVAGKTSETALKNQLSRYCGIVKTDEVSEIVNSANCKKATGYYPDSLKDGYVDGKLSKDNVISALKVYKGLDSTSASNRVRAWDFQKEHPDLKWDSDRVDAYYDKRPEGGGKSAYEAGISVETYDDYRNRAAKAKGVDANGDGKTDSGSKKAEILRIIDSLDLSRSQKDALYYINGWAASTIYEAPWH